MKTKLSLLLIAALCASGSVVAADAAAGKNKSATCAGCHGPDGVSFIPNYPNLKGQKSAYIVKQLKDFKSGTRKDPIMGAQAGMLSDEDVENLAAYYESMK